VVRLLLRRLLWLGLLLWLLLLARLGGDRRWRRQRSDIIVGQRQNFDHAILGPVRQDHRVRAERLAHTAQRVARGRPRETFHIHGRPPVPQMVRAGLAAAALCVDIVNSCCTSVASSE
jgi:hypothetical protein